MANDQYANIAAGGVHTLGKGLQAPTPEAMNKKVWGIEKQEKQIAFPPKMSTKEELYEELESWKQKFRPFLQRLAPQLMTSEKKEELKEFFWRIETKDDQQDFISVLEGQGDWEKVSIPHYGKPLGMAVTFYRTEFSVSWEKEEAVFLDFKGVDYIAQVFVNGSYAGSHEGFFAPFQLDVTRYAKQGVNTLVVRVENDFVHKRNEKELRGTMYGGDKIYAATGPGFDDPEMGWHHCPPGMGIWQSVFVEVKNRCFLKDVYVRPLPEEDMAEAWVEIYKCDPGYEEVKLSLSLYGRNFEETVFEHMVYQPVTGCAIGLGDSFTEAVLTASGAIDKPVQLKMEKGVNYLRIPFTMEAFRQWNPETPYLYELQVSLVKEDGQIMHRKAQSFGMRSFIMDTDNLPKGSFYLNGQQIRLRGANTMGHEQQSVMKGDTEQIIDDILLARICHMNFLRLTQRPVQEEVYEYCDMLGMLTQTDLPLFGVLRINKFNEALRQTEELEKLVRKHPCNILVSYINEPFPNAYNQPHRHLSRPDLMRFFDCADAIVKMNNPERVTKHVDGDYDPPSKTLPDNHCYTLWYNGCGVDAGELNKGYWLPVMKDWNYGCGEFGAEGLDCLETMEKYYPKHWLPANQTEEKSWTPANIIASQTGNFHYFFYDTKTSVKEWIDASQQHQAWATKWMSEAFRRNKRMVSTAIHLFIDAFPAGWMKTIMDVDRNPKPAYFAYRDALTPVMVSLRNDRYCYHPGELASVEVWGCNDQDCAFDRIRAEYKIEGLNKEGNNEFIGQGEQWITLSRCSSDYLGNVEFTVPKDYQKLRITAGIRKEDGELLHYNEMMLEVKPDTTLPDGIQGCIFGEKGLGKSLAEELNLRIVDAVDLKSGDIILIDNWKAFAANRAEIEAIVSSGAKAIFLELEAGEYRMGEKTFQVKASSMLPMNFASRKTGHSLVEGFQEFDFRNWYDRKLEQENSLWEEAAYISVS
ncbi:MAG: ebgA 3 [Herbinix sp.]|nr:ebgA 3 [Herbinix sp.]